MSDYSDRAYERGETLHNACLCCEHAAGRIKELRQVIIGVLEARKSGRKLSDQWEVAVLSLLARHEPEKGDE